MNLHLRLFEVDSKNPQLSHVKFDDNDFVLQIPAENDDRQYVSNVLIFDMALRQCGGLASNSVLILMTHQHDLHIIDAR